MEKISHLFCFLLALTLSFRATLPFELTKPQLLTSVSQGSPVYGVVSTNGSLLVIRENSSSVHVYSTSGRMFTPSAPLDVLNRIGYFDMVYLPFRNSLALLNWFNSYDIFILELDPPRRLRSFMFTTVLTTAALAVGKNDAGTDDTIIVTEGATRSIKVFSPDGEELLKISLRISADPRHSIKLTNNIFATTFGYDPNEAHYVCRFTIWGFIAGRCLGGRPGNGTTRVNVPARMILTSDKKSILLADMKNRRILKVATDLSTSSVLLDASDGVQYPYRLELDEAYGLLYVAENELAANGWAVGGKVNVYGF